MKGEAVKLDEGNLSSTDSRSSEVWTSEVRRFGGAREGLGAVPPSSEALEKFKFCGVGSPEERADA